MKKIYSFIAVASLMLTSVLSFTSCQKDEMPSTIAKTQTGQTQQPQQQGNSNASGTTGNTGNTTSTGAIIGIKVDGKQIDFDKKLDTSYAVGEWTATVNGTEFTLVVSNSSAKSDYNTDYKATLKMGDQSYDGTYMAVNFMYTARFDTDEKIDGVHEKAWLDCIAVNESNLKEFTVKFIHVDGKTIAEDVKFVKK